MSRRTPAQGGLWGRQETLPATTGAKRRPVINDLDLVTAVIRSAEDPGYVVIGPSERVFLRDPTAASASSSPSHATNPTPSPNYSTLVT